MLDDDDLESRFSLFSILSGPPINHWGFICKADSAESHKTAAAPYNVKLCKDVENVLHFIGILTLFGLIVKGHGLHPHQEKPKQIIFDVFANDDDD